MAEAELAPMRACSKCGEAKPLTNEYFQHRSSGRIDWTCRGCRRAYMADYYGRNREAMLSRVRSARAANPEFHRERDRRYFQENREAKRDSAKRKWAKADKAEARRKIVEWKAANPEKARAIEVRRNEKIKNTPELRAKARERVKRHRERLGPEEYNRRQREARAANPELSRGYVKKWRENNIERVREHERAYRESNREKIIADTEKRRARMLGAEGEFTGHDIIALIKSFGRVCYYCGVRLKRYQVDHFIPLARGGSNWPDNLVLSCQPCNGSKGAKMPWDWQPSRFAEGCKPR
jgi:5-methylcytosine-specific restriction endonuclease McrA